MKKSAKIRERELCRVLFHACELIRAIDASEDAEVLRDRARYVREAVREAYVANGWDVPAVYNL